MLVFVTFKDARSVLLEIDTPDRFLRAEGFVPAPVTSDLVISILKRDGYADVPSTFAVLALHTDGNGVVCELDRISEMDPEHPTALAACADDEFGNLFAPMFSEHVEDLIDVCEAAAEEMESDPTLQAHAQGRAVKDVPGGSVATVRVDEHDHEEDPIGDDDEESDGAA